MGHYIGIAFNDDYTSICIDDDDKLQTVPTAVCKEKQSSAWHIGEEAYKLTLDGSGVVVDKLLSLVKKRGTATIDGVCHSAEELLGCFFRALLREIEEIDAVVVTIRKPDPVVMTAVGAALQKLGYEKEKIQIISHTESFVHFVLAQEKELYSQQVGMFELSNQCLYYYEMKVSRGNRKLVLADSQAQEEAFNLDILKTAAGEKIADKILTSLAERILAKKTFSSIFLCGKGFESIDYAAGFMAYICNRRRVCVEANMFAIGAAMQAGMLAGGREPEEYTVICDTKVTSNVGVKVVLREKETVLPIVQAGDGWFDRAGRLEAILDGQDYVELVISPVDQMKRTNVKITLDGFPKRENRTTRILMTMKFTEADRLQITIKDKGFGDLFPASDAFIHEEIQL